MIDTMNTTSQWAIGTYELVLDFSGADKDVDVMATVFAMPITDDPAADEDAPVLSQMGMVWGELGQLVGPFSEKKNVILKVGEQGMGPEEMEKEFGPKAGVRMLLLLFQAANADFKGVDMDGVPWRSPSDGAFPILERTHDVMAVLKTRLYNM